MGNLGREAKRVRRAIWLTVLVVVGAVLLVAAAPSSADTTDFTVVADGSTALNEQGSTSQTFTVTLTGDAPLTPVTISVTGGGTDVTATQLSLSDATPSGQITVTAVDDNVYEPGGPETINLNFTSSPNVGSKPASVTVADNDAAPTASIAADVSLPEGTGASPTHFDFTVQLSRPSAVPISVNYQTLADTANSADFACACLPVGTLTFPANNQSQTLRVDVAADDAVESDETFFVNLPAYAAQKKGTILNDDVAAPPPTLTITAPPPVDEGIGTAHLTVTLSAASSSTVTVIATTSDGTAQAPGDYAAVVVPVTIPAGQLTGDVPVPITNDSLDEDSETFTVTLSSPTGATIATGAATVTITDNDNTSKLDVSDPPSVNEPASGGSVNVVFNVSLSAPSARTVTVQYATVAGTATSPSDFTAASGTLTFAPGGPTTQQVTVVVKGDAVNEPNESFTLVLSNPVGALIGDGSGFALIVDPSAPPSLTIADGAVDEGAGSIAVAVTLSGNASAQTVTVDYTTASGTATSGVDFTATSGKLTFAPGETSKTITVPITNDTVGEADETFSVTLSNPVGATIAKNRSSVRIVDNDPVPGGATPPATKKPTTTTPTPTTTTPAATVTTPVLRTLQVKLMWIKLAGKVDGKARVAIRISLQQKVSAKVVMLQGKRKISSSPFDLLRGNRTVFVVMPAFAKPGKVKLQLAMTSPQGAKKTLNATVTLEAPAAKTGKAKTAKPKTVKAKTVKPKTTK